MKKTLSYIFILLILVGLFSPMVKMNAQTVTPQQMQDSLKVSAELKAEADAKAAADKAIADANKANDTQKSSLYDNLSCFNGLKIDVGGCLGKLFYFFLVVIPSWLLTLAAQFFNAILAIGLSRDLFNASFVSQAWVIVRDLSNIFFILILLYVAIQTILGIGHETKKVIVNIIIMALLINFSMFFTRIVIDSSNILAMVFYNKINSGNTTPATTFGEKDISSKMAEAFNPSKMISAQFFEAAKKTTAVIPKSGITFTGTAAATVTGLLPMYLGWKLVGYFSPTDSLPIELILGIELVSGAIMLFATYAFFMAGVIFLSRLIELWVLIIFSPFAFMSWTIPQLASIESIGWQSWLKRLLKVAFMAPVFMFFLYLIFMLINANLFSDLMRDKLNPSTTETILFIVIPAIVVIGLLLKATKWAKDASGEMGGMVLKAGGFALGATAAIVSGGATMAVGGLSSVAASSKGINDLSQKNGWRGTVGKMALRTADYGSKASFDFRNAPGIKSLAKAGGLNIGSATNEGGYMKKRAENIKKRQERAKQLEVREDEPMKQALNKSEQNLQVLLNKVAKDFEEIDHELEDARQDKADAGTDKVAYDAAVTKIKNLKEQKDNIKHGKTRDGTKENDDYKVEGENISTLRHNVTEQKAGITKENRDRRWKYAESEQKWNHFITGGRFNPTRIGRRTVDEANHDIRMEAKIESGKDDHGGGGHGGEHKGGDEHMTHSEVHEVHAEAPHVAPTPATPAHGTPPAAGGGAHGGHP